MTFSFSQIIVNNPCMYELLKSSYDYMDYPQLHSNTTFGDGQKEKVIENQVVEFLSHGSKITMKIFSICLHNSSINHSS